MVKWSHDTQICADIYSAANGNDAGCISCHSFCYRHPSEMRKSCGQGRLPDQCPSCQAALEVEQSSRGENPNGGLSEDDTATIIMILGIVIGSILAVGFLLSSFCKNNSPLQTDLEMGIRTTEDEKYIAYRPHTIESPTSQTSSNGGNDENKKKIVNGTPLINTSSTGIWDLFPHAKDSSSVPGYMQRSRSVPAVTDVRMSASSAVSGKAPVGQKPLPDRMSQSTPKGKYHTKVGSAYADARRTSAHDDRSTPQSGRLSHSNPSPRFGGPTPRNDFSPRFSSHPDEVDMAIRSSRSHQSNALRCSGPRPVGHQPGGYRISMGHSGMRDSGNRSGAVSESSTRLPSGRSQRGGEFMQVVDDHMRVAQQ